MPSYVLTRAAEDDVREIARYTLKRWGEAQSLRYAEALEQCFEQLGNRWRTARPVLDRFPAVRVSRCQHHYVFFLARDGHPPLIVAVLHKRMDMLRRLKKRLP